MKINSSLKTKKILKKALGTVLAVGVLFFGGLFVREGINNLSYTSQATIHQNLEDFGVVNPYVFKDEFGTLRRLANNGDEPVYVTFDENFENEPFYKEMAINSLDYVFDMVHEINPLYRYKIISEKQANEKAVIGKSIIQYKAFDFNKSAYKESMGVETHQVNLHDIIFWDHIASNNRISVDFARFDDLDDLVLGYIFTHELLHAFGFDDVYKIFYYNGVLKSDKKTRLRADTFMQSQVGEAMHVITPKDYATLCALYYPKTKIGDKKYKSYVTSKIEEYTDMYYKIIDQRVLKSLGWRYMFGEKKLSKPDASVANFSFDDFSVKYSEDGSVKNIYLTQIKVQITGDTYRLQLFDGQGDILDECEGKTIETEHFLVLKGCYFKHGISPLNDKCRYQDGYVDDLCIFEEEGEFKAVFSYNDEVLNKCDAERYGSVSVKEIFAE